MMETRKSDPRIYIITFLFLSCIVSGGILLALYVVLPLSKPLYLLAGMVLVCVPWVFWFLAYLYRCIIKPCTAQIARDSNLNNNNNVKTSKNNPTSATEGSPEDPGHSSASDDEHTAMRTPRDGERHVQFGGVTVIGHEEEKSISNLTQNRNDDEHGEETDGSRDLDWDDHRGSSFSMESDQMPLRLSIAVSC